jgi:hypothetical protein
MLLTITFTTIAALLSITSFKTVKRNLMATKELDKSTRRMLIWRYGPYRIDDHTIAIHTNDRV